VLYFKSRPNVAELRKRRPPKPGPTAQEAELESDATFHLFR
jgi:hypothetical protein